MPSLLFGISAAAVLSLTSLLIILFRVSPLTAPEQAVTAFLVSLFLSIGTGGTLLFMLLWRYVPELGWDTGKLTSISLRQGILLGAATTVLVLFHLLGLLTWWIGIMIYGMFFLVEAAMKH